MRLTQLWTFACWLDRTQLSIKELAHRHTHSSVWESVIVCVCVCLGTLLTTQLPWKHIWNINNVRQQAIRPSLWQLMFGILLQAIPTFLCECNLNCQKETATCNMSGFRTKMQQCNNKCNNSLGVWGAVDSHSFLLFFLHFNQAPPLSLCVPDLICATTPIVNPCLPLSFFYIDPTSSKYSASTTNTTNTNRHFSTLCFAMVFFCCFF